MKSLLEFLTDLRQQHIKIWAEGGRLRAKAPEGALSQAIRTQLAERKIEILAFLNEASAATVSPHEAILPVSREGSLPLSFAQERLWFLDQLEGPSATYNSAVACRLRGPFDLAAFERAVNEVVRRHEILRTSFIVSHAQPTQAITPELSLNIQVRHHETPSDAFSVSMIQEILLAETQQTFDLTRAPLLRMTCVNLNKNDIVLIAVMHHVISDGWSGYIFTKELAALYKAFSAGQPSPLPELPIQYADFAIWEREQMQGERLQTQLEYWKEKLSGVPTSLDLPTDLPRPEHLTSQGAEQRLQLPLRLSKNLQAFSVHEEVTLFITLWTVFQLVLHAYSGQEDFVVATSDANRDREEVEPLIGFFINQTLLVSDLHGNPRLRELLQRVNQNTLEAYANKHIPFSRLVQELNIERESNRNPLFQILFILQNFPEIAIDFGPGTDTQLLELPVHTSRLDSMITIWQQKEGLEVRWEYSTELFHDETIRLLLETYQDFLTEALRHPERRISDFSLPEMLCQQVEHIRQQQRAQHDMHLHHLGFACRDIQKGIQCVRNLYSIKQIGDILYDELQDVQICMIETHNGVRIELIAGKTVEHLVQQGVILYQMCYEVPDIFYAMQQFQTQGAILISEPKPARLFENRLVAFFNTELGLIELLEKTPSKRSADVIEQFRSAVSPIPQQTLGIAATFTAEPLQSTIDFWMHTLHIPVQCRFAPYNQVFQQLLDSSSLLATNAQGLNLVLVRLEDWHAQQSTPDSPTSAMSGYSEELTKTVLDFIEALKTRTEHTKIPYLVCLCPASPDILADPVRAELFRTMEALVVSELEPVSAISLITPNSLTAVYPVGRYDDPHADTLGHVPFTPQFFSALGTMIARTFHAMTRKPYKVIVLDCDGTLWKGVCGEDGPVGIDIGGPYTVLQEFMVAQHRAGMLLCIASKNNEADVLDVFAQRHDMPLKREHFVATRINWQPKSRNIIDLANELQLGLDSFIFLDDNPVECAEVTTNCPQVTTIQLPADTDSIPQFLRHFWAFDHLNITREDTQRTELYRQNAQRERFRKESPTFENFLDNLDLHVRISTMRPHQLPRVSQLTQRTNQFNLTTIRRSERQIQTLCNTDDHECFVTEVHDRFGDYGLVGVMFAQTCSDRLKVETFLLSCRALGRGVEHQMLAYLGKLCLDHGIKTLEVAYVPTPKNTPALDFLKSTGASVEKQESKGSIFSFPADFAAKLVYRPRNVSLESMIQELPSRPPLLQREGEKTGMSPSFSPPLSLQERGPGGEFPQRSELFTQIATTLARPEDIIQAIHAHNTHSRPEMAERFVPPRNSVEEALAAIWSELLNVEQVGIYDHFFRSGGHSLLGTQLLSQIYQKFQVTLPLQTLFEKPTIAQMAAQIISQSAGQFEEDQPNLSIRPIPRDTPMPLSFAQQRIWFLCQIEDQNIAYNEPVALRLTGTLEKTILEQCFHEIVRRHEILRTSFVPASDGSPRQIIASQPSISVFETDLQHLSGADQEMEIQRLCVEEIQKPFDLTRIPLFRVNFFILGEHEHFLLITAHHIIVDGWSFGIMVRELISLYQAFSTGQPSPLPELAIQYADFAHWQREWLQGDILERQCAYWKQQLSGEPPVLELPTDHSRLTGRSFQGAKRTFALPKALTDSLNSLSQHEECSLFMTLFAAFTVLLYRYTGQEDIVVGSVTANRNRAEIEPLIGFFVNTLALRTDLSGNPSVREVLKRVRKTILDAHAHQDMPFEQVVAETHPKRESGSQPLFRNLFVLQNAPIQPLTLPNLTVVPAEIHNSTAKFDLILEMRETEDELVGTWEYDTELFTEEAINHMAEHLRILLDGIIQNPEQPIAALPLLNDTEHHHILTEWNNTKTEYPDDTCVHELFEIQSERTPESVAVSFGEQRITYRELDQRANQVAHYLDEMDVKPGMLAGIYMERSVEMIVSLLAILKIGAAYVPLDLSYPKERLRFMIEDARMPVLLTQEALVEKLPGLDTALICLDKDMGKILQRSIEKPAHQGTPDDLAYVIYTSGSTGKPKGVAVPHRAINRLVFNTNYIHINSSDNIAQASNASFDAATFEIWGALLHGAQLVGIPRNIVLNLQEFATSLQKHKISILFLTTALFNRMADEIPTAFHGLHTLLFGGEAVSPHWVKEILMQGPPERLLHVYGPTETTTFATWYLVESVPDNANTIPIGRPISNTSCYILDQHLQAVPVGIPGELYIGGTGLALEYLHRPGLTQEKFIQNPFSSDAPEDRLYKTGDLVRYLPDGSIEFLGRIDNQVKLRGFRIELGEIESVLSHHPSVKEAVVLIREDTPGDKRLAAYLMPVDNAEQTVTGVEVREYLKEKLPDYMIPSAYVVLETFPLNANGKIDRRALPAPEGSGLEEQYVAPRTSIETSLTDIWADVLNLDRIGVHDDFFEIGGHSLLAVRLMARIRKEFGQNLELAALFERPTVESLAKKLQEMPTSQVWSPIVPIQPNGSLPPLYCIHPGGGTVLCYADLARLLGADQPFFGIRALGLEEDQESQATVEDMARYYMTALQTTQCQGPYFLAGWSLGGLVAFEMTLQLLEKGQHVAFLGLIDTGVPSFELTEEYGNKSDIEHLVEIIGLNELPGYNIEQLMSRLHRLPYEEQLQCIAKEAKDMYLIPSDVEAEFASRFLQLGKIHTLAAANYIPQQHYPGTVTFFQAQEHQPVDGWQNFASEVETYCVSGNHHTMMLEPNVHTLATRLQQCLARARTML